MPNADPAIGLDEFRRSFQGWLHDHLPADWRDVSRGEPEEVLMPIRREWGRRLHEGGWLGITWPIEAGGRGLSLEHEVILNEEQVSAGAPEPLNSNGIQILGPLLIKYGTRAQQQRFLNPMLSHEEIWCQGFSEPDAGSDLANLKTRAVRDDAGWRLTGQKVWTTYGHVADWCYLLARTEAPTARKHDGISMFVASMRQPRITVRPLKNITGSFEFNEVFFDDAIARGDELVGEPGDGWRMAMEALSFERGLSFAARALKLGREFSLVASLADGQDEAVHEELATSFVATRAMKAIVVEILRRDATGADLELLPSIAKLYWSESHQELLRLAGELNGDRLGEPGRVHWLQARLAARAESIYGGTSEIQRNLIARGLGLPSGR